MEIFKDGDWGVVCDDYFGVLDAQVACRQLGYHDKGAKTKTDVPSSTPDLPFLITNTECNGEEERLLDCSHDVPSSYSCHASETAGVDCVMVPPNFAEGEVRLADVQEEGNYVSGFLAIFTDGEWGYFCGELDHNVSQVACRDLGYFDKGKKLLQKFLDEPRLEFFLAYIHPSVALSQQARSRLTTITLAPVTPSCQDTEEAAKERKLLCRNVCNLSLNMVAVHTLRSFSVWWNRNLETKEKCAL